MGDAIIIVGNDGCFEPLVIFDILKCANHRLGCESMSGGVAAGMLFAFFATRTSAFASVAAVGLDLLERSHEEAAAFSIGSLSNRALLVNNLFDLALYA